MRAMTPLSTLHRRALPAARRQRGLSLVEMMVGVAVGLFVVAGAAMLAASQLGENRRLLLETQVQQDLRATLDIVTRELRRSGYHNTAHTLLWSADDPQRQPRTNIWAGLTYSQGGEVVSYAYDRSGATATDYGYRLAAITINGSSRGVVRQRVGNSAPQDLTDVHTLDVTTFTVQPQVVAAEQLACPRLCAGDTQDCWPTRMVTHVLVTISGRAPSDPNIVRTMSSRVRLRNDAVKSNISPTQLCP